MGISSGTFSGVSVSSSDSATPALSASAFLAIIFDVCPGSPRFFTSDSSRCMSESSCFMYPSISSYAPVDRLTFWSCRSAMRCLFTRTSDAGPALAFSRSSTCEPPPWPDDAIEAMREYSSFSALATSSLSSCASSSSWRIWRMRWRTPGGSSFKLARYRPRKPFPSSIACSPVSWSRPRFCPVDDAMPPAARGCVWYPRVRVDAGRPLLGTHRTRACAAKD
mmetsp:Transcript_95996/g.273690  ORF Transcript_95996/g.273690 Transcript_95996/m.273690 type:complete len:222 (+) Transcript_95996:559-1224(+)